jgi:tRNA G18 (ribose-2'-O)-methylase SpoU
VEASRPPAGPPEVIDVVSTDDRSLLPYLGLREAALRRGQRETGGLFIAEGPLVVRRAIAAGYEPQSYLLTPRWVDDLADVWSTTTAPVYRAPTSLIESITGFHVHRGALAALRRAERWQLADLLVGRRLVVAEDLVDHANLGAILRSAAGLGWDGFIATAGCADPLYRRAVKTSMGAVFDLPWVRLPHDCDLVATLQAAGFVVVALAPQPGAYDLAAVRNLVMPKSGPARRIALFCGSEGPGLSPATLAAADLVAGIPMARSIDSLNVAAAAAIACYVLGPDRSGGSPVSQP